MHAPHGKGWRAQLCPNAGQVMMAAREAASQTAATATMARSRTTHSAPPSSSFRRHDRRVKNEFLLRSREPASFFLLRCQQSRIHRPGSPPLRPLEGSPSFGCLPYPVHLCIQRATKNLYASFSASSHLRSRNSNRHPPEALVFFRVVDVLLTPRPVPPCLLLVRTCT